MNNQINDLYKSVTNIELVEAIKQISEDGKTGIICDGAVRKYAKKIGEITGGSPLDLWFAEINLLRVAAYRWHDGRVETSEEINIY